MTSGPCDGKGITTTVVPKSRIGTGFQQQSTHLGMAAHGCQDERRSSLSVTPVDGSAAPQLEGDCRRDTGCER
jgi:hypothetical protein